MYSKKSILRTLITLLILFLIIGILLYIKVVVPNNLDGRFSFREVNNNLLKKDSIRIAFSGDYGVTENTQKNLNLIKSEKADILMMLGDFDYIDQPSIFIEMLESTLGDINISGVIGNHDLPVWTTYSRYLSEKRKQFTEVDCSGEVGIKESCKLGNIRYINVGINLLGKDHLEFLETELSKSEEKWKICMWHFNHRTMQVGYKETEAPIEAYDICRKHGAIIVKGHEHSYSRTHLMSDFENLTIASTNSVIDLKEGQTISTVSGLGGHSIRESNPEHATQPYWASIYTADQGGKSGSLFCDFETKTEEPIASCYFKNIDGEIIDEYTLVSHL